MVRTARGAFQVRLLGPASAPLALCLHGFPDIAATFDGLARALADAGWRSAAVQSRGYAPSVLDLPRGRHLFDTLADDALAVADSLAPGRPIAVIGHDNGAFATYALLRKAPPGRVAAAVTLTAAHPAAVFRNTGRLPRQIWRSRYAMLFQLPRLSEWWASRRDFAYVEALWRRWARPGWTPPPGHLAAVKRTLRESWPAPLLHYRAMPFGGDETPLRTPTLYMIGTEDGCVLPEAGGGQERFFAAAFEAVRIPSAGHFLHLERPDLVTPRILDWLARHRPAA